MNEGKIAYITRQGNSYADSWAEEAAKLNQVPAIEKNRPAWIDSTAWLIQSRIIAVAQHYLEKRQPKEPKGPRALRDPNTTLELLGHIPCPDEARKDWWYCSLCSARWANAQRRHMGKMGRCPGPRNWETPPQPSQQPWRLRHGARLVHNGKEVHASHALRWQRGIIYCNLCGAYSNYRMVNLSLSAS